MTVDIEEVYDKQEIIRMVTACAVMRKHVGFFLDGLSPDEREEWMQGFREFLAQRRITLE